MALIGLGYFSFAVAIFLFASHPLLADMRNTKSFVSNLLMVLKEKRKGSVFLAISFLHLLLATSVFSILVLFDN